ncbi:MAG: SWIM zinc finger family protein [Planctomycetes bacterium]|nr:SWIM zinc finger family protein [Planctomycetota bacterium]
MSWEYREWYAPSRPREAKGGIKARSRAGRIGSTWWSQRWLQVLDSFGWTNRLARGRSYARRGQVLDFKIEAGRVTADVQGSRPDPYDVEIKLKQLTAKQWDAVVAAMGAKASFAAKLLAGTLPPEAEDVFKAADVPLFPRSGRDFDADCSCPDSADCCKHIAAVHYLLAEQFDRDPFMLFALRGRARDEILAALKVAPTSATPKEAPAEPLSPDRFQTLGPGFANVVVAPPAPPSVDLAILRRLGEPAFLKGDRLKRLESIYRAATRWAAQAGADPTGSDAP